MGLSQGRIEALHLKLLFSWIIGQMYCTCLIFPAASAENLGAIEGSEGSLLSSLCCRWTSAQQVHTSSKKVAAFSPRM